MFYSCRFDGLASNSQLCAFMKILADTTTFFSAEMQFFSAEMMVNNLRFDSQGSMAVDGGR